MSSKQRLTGKGKLKKEDIDTLRTRLQHVYNEEIRGFSAEQLSSMGFPERANDRTRLFVFIDSKRYNRWTFNGEVLIDVKTGNFYFHVTEADHALIRVADNSEVYHELMDFLIKMPTEDEECGAEIVYFREDTQHYGGWADVRKGVQL